MIKKGNWNLKWNMLENEEKMTDNERFFGVIHGLPYLSLLFIVLEFFE